MNVITTTSARQHLSQLIGAVHRTRRSIAIGKRNKAEVLLIRFPDSTNLMLDEMTNMNQYGGGFDFLEDEPDIYTRRDLIKTY
ncbi:type II toxin-antitoxin system Phd/YefM family antitoxin [Candidatus Uhrbacteria bacterium]|nr:type II toxin-antitoxin system Phd/YefM family antitoxin [Candidatus Uhrbacteria bacterium]